MKPHRLTACWLVCLLLMLPCAAQAVAVETVAQPTADMGAAAISMVLSRLHGEERDVPPREAVLAARLIVRESSAVAATANGKEQPKQ